MAYLPLVAVIRAIFRFVKLSIIVVCCHLSLMTLTHAVYVHNSISSAKKCKEVENDNNL